MGRTTNMGMMGHAEGIYYACPKGNRCVDWAHLARGKHSGLFTALNFWVP